MNTESIGRQFERLGTRLVIRAPAPPRGQRAWWWEPPRGYSLDVGRDRKGEHFLLTVSDDSRAGLDLQILQSRPNNRHLLLMARQGEHADIDRFLCGHDEREWFVAAVPGQVSTVADAMESLKPAEVRAAQSRAGLGSRQRNRRKNVAFRRQGEWFFLPVGDVDFDPGVVLRNEPIARSGGKPHMVQYLVRSAGEMVWVCWRHPSGVGEARYREILESTPSSRGWGWERRMRGAAVFAKGEIRHRDHQTICLRGWHQVLMNTESESRTMRHVAFLD